jgi:hypothetical protein
MANQRGSVRELPSLSIADIEAKAKAEEGSNSSQSRSSTHNVIQKYKSTRD